MCAGAGNRILSKSWIIVALLVGACIQQKAISDSNRIATLFEEGKYREAVALGEQALQLTEAELGPKSKVVATSLDNLAFLYQTLGDLDKAAPMYRRALTIRQDIFDADDPVMAISYSHLGDLTRARGDYATATGHFERSLQILEKAHADGNPDLAVGLNNLADVYAKQNRLVEAERLYGRALTILKDSYPIDERQIGIVHGNRANVFIAMGRYEEAEGAFEQALAKQRQGLPSHHPDIAVTLNNLANLYILLGDYDKAVESVSGALAILETKLGTDHPDVAVVLGNLAGFRLKQGRYEEAAGFLERALATQQSTLGLDHPQTAATLTSLTTLYYEAGDYERAARIARQIVAINEKAWGVSHPLYAQSLRTLGEIERRRGRHGEAKASLEQALETLDAAGAHKSPEAVTVLTSLGLLTQELGALEEAEAFYLLAVQTARSVLGSDNPLVASAYVGLAKLYFRMERFDAALTTIRRATTIHRKRIARAGGALDNATLQKVRSIFFTHLDTAWKAMEQKAVFEGTWLEEIFEVSQLARSTGTAAVLTNMTARFASGSDALARALRRHQDTLTHRQGLDAQLFESMGRAVAERDLTAEEGLRRAIAELDDELQDSNAALSRKFPRYAELTNPKPLTLSTIRMHLTDQEAIVSYLIGRESSYAIVVTRRDAAIRRLPIGGDDLGDQVMELRHGLDPTGMTSIQDLPEFPLQQAHKLYRAVFEPVASLLDGIERVYVVPDGALQNIPMAVLVTEAPSARTKDTETYTAAHWLIRRYALSVLPSVGSLVSLRKFAKQSTSPKPFLGIGDPALGGQVEGSRGISPQSLFVSKRGTQASSKVIMQRVGKLPNLPETRKELTEIAATLGPNSRLLLGNEATESSLRDIDLAQYRVVAFATHGLMAGDFSGLAEPALVMTPPDRASERDDGLLTASEISALKLNADWVILSACNTAAPVGRPGAEGLSGLAKSFFYAGSRSLLVSHWSVWSSPTVLLTTGLFSWLSKNPGMSKAAALRRSMLDLMASKETPAFAHPMFWAPFVIVGEGGGDRPAS